MDTPPLAYIKQGSGLQFEILGKQSHETVLAEGPWPTGAHVLVASFALKFKLCILFIFYY